jgi:hypothetical protein
MRTLMIKIDNLDLRLKDIQAFESRILHDKNSLSYRINLLEDEVLQLGETIEDHIIVGTLFRGLLDDEVAKAKQSLEDITTEALQTIFTDQDLSVRVDVTTKRDKVYANIVTLRKMPDGSVIEGDVLTSFGGAVATVQCLILRLIVTIKQNLRPVILLDESLAAISREYIIRTAKFLRHLCRTMGAKVLIVTHNPHLVAEADNAYEVALVRDEATIRTLGAKK